MDFLIIGNTNILGNIFAPINTYDGGDPKCPKDAVTWCPNPRENGYSPE